MGYSTFMRNGCSGDSYDTLKFHIDGAGKTKQRYILATSIEDYPLHRIKEKMDGVEGVRAICQVNNTIDIVVSGEDQAKKVASELHRKTMAPIGIVKYDSQSMGKLYCQLSEALDIARKEGKTFHIYDPKKDSLQAIIKAALSENSATQ